MELSLGTLPLGEGDGERFGRRLSEVDRRRLPDLNYFLSENKLDSYLRPMRLIHLGKSLQSLKAWVILYAIRPLKIL